MRFIIGLIFIITTFCCYAKWEPPKGCNAIALKSNSENLKTFSSPLWLVYNSSNSDVWISYIPKSEDNLEAIIRLSPDKWAAQISHFEEFEWICIESKPGHEQEVKCRDVLMICEYKRSKPPKKLGRRVWIGANESLDLVKAHLNRRGFKLPDDEVL